MSLTPNFPNASCWNFANARPTTTRSELLGNPSPHRHAPARSPPPLTTGSFGRPDAGARRLGVLGGEQKYGETYKQSLAVTGMSYGTLANIASVCKVYESSWRHELSYEHHRVAASLDPEQRQEVLDQAEREGKPAAWVREVGTASRRWQNSCGSPTPDREPQAAAADPLVSVTRRVTNPAGNRSCGGPVGSIRCWGRFGRGNPGRWQAGHLRIASAGSFA